MTREEQKELALRILSVVAVSGFLAAVVVAPGLVYIASLFLDRKYVPRQKVNRSLKYALDRKWLQVERHKQKPRLILTELGKRRVAQRHYGLDAIPTPEKWDRKWRVVIFDIPNKRKQARDVLRQRFRILGLRQLQESVWIYPYPCAEIIHGLANLYLVSPYVRVLIVSHFDGEDEFLQKFNLAGINRKRSSDKLGYLTDGGFDKM